MAEHQLLRSKACRIVSFSRSALYRPTVDWAAKDAPVIAALNEMVSKRSRWSFWKYFQRLRLDGHDWNHKRVHKVYCAIKLNLQRKDNKRVVTEAATVGCAQSHQTRLGLGLHTQHDV